MPAGAVIVTTDTTGEALPYMQATVICRDVREGKVYRVLCNAETDPALIYYYAEIEFAAASVLYLRVGDESGVLDTVTLSWTAPTAGLYLYTAIEDNSTGAFIDPTNVVFFGIVQGGTDLSYTFTEDADPHDIDDLTDEIDIVYGFSIGVGKRATEVQIVASVEGLGDTVKVKAYDHALAEWTEIASIDGTAALSYQTLTPALKPGVSAGEAAETGKVYIRFDNDSTTPSNLSVDKLVVEAIYITNYRLTACRTEEGLYATTGDISTSPISTSAWDCVVDNGGRYAGLMNNSSALDVEFDNFVFTRGFDENGDRCFYCDCECEGQCLADTLTLTFTATGFCNSCLDGVEIPLTVIKGDDIIKWAGTKTIYSTTCDYTATASFRLECDWGNKQFTLYDINQHPGWDGWTPGSPQSAVPYSINCDPLVIIFPLNAVGNTFSHTISEPCGVLGCDCFYTITITE